MANRNRALLIGAKPRKDLCTMNVTPLLFAYSLGVLAMPIAAQPGQYDVQTDKYHVTDAERAACQIDATKLCSDAFPDEDALLACMKTKLVQLTPLCRTTFEAGLRRRGIQF